MIKNLELKLSGELPIDKEELFELVSYWGRKNHFDCFNSQRRIYKSNPSKCYDLSNLDVSKIYDFSELFRESFYNGDLSKWDVSKSNSLFGMFLNSDFNNNSINNWDISNIKDLRYVFSRSSFCGDVSSWKFNLDSYTSYIFRENKYFQDLYNNGNKIPNNTQKEFLEWFEKNREKMKEINNPREEVLSFFSFDNESNITLQCNI